MRRPTYPTFPNGNPPVIALAQMDGDGRPDIVVGGFGNPSLPFVIILYNPNFGTRT